MPHRLFIAALVAGWLATGGSARAHKDGMDARMHPSDGKAICNACHSGGTEPTVTLSGPRALELGQMATYTLHITGGAGVAGGFNVSVTDSSVEMIPGADSHKPAGDVINFAPNQVTHVLPKNFVNGEVMWDFQIKPPNNNTTFLIWGQGNSTNKSDTPMGDYASVTSFCVDVGSKRLCPPVDGGATPDARVATADVGRASGSDGDAGNGAADADQSTADLGGCGCRVGARRSPTVPPVPLAVAAALTLARRRRSKRG